MDGVGTTHNLARGKVLKGQMTTGFEWLSKADAGVEEACLALRRCTS